MKQWLFVASDTIDREDKWDFVKNTIITDGVNIAFVTNSSKNYTDRPVNENIYLQYIQKILIFETVFCLVT